MAISKREKSAFRDERMDNNQRRLEIISLKANRETDALIHFALDCTDASLVYRRKTMRKIGTTDSIADTPPEIMVYMSFEEWRVFELLKAAVQGELPNDFGEVSHYEIGHDLESVFRAILLWVQLRFKVSALQRKVDALKGLLEDIDE